MSEGHTALVALGSNVGDRSATLTSALAALADDCQVHVSSVYETEPVGMAPGARPVLNAVCRFDTAEREGPLMQRLLRLEELSGRRREPGAASSDRTLDLDLLLLGHRLSDTATVTLPHPRLHRRAFVLVPACDVAADMVHPLLDKTLSQLLERLPDHDTDLVRAGRRSRGGRRKEHP